MARVTRFEIYADDPDRASAFYSKVFSWEIKKWGESNEYWKVTTGPDSQPGINGGIIRRQNDGKAGQSDMVMGYVCTIDIESNIDEVIEEVVLNGGEVAVQKMPITGKGWLAYCKDTEGNIFGIMQRDATVNE